MIKLTSWNVRGINDPIKVASCRKFLYENKVDIMAFLETKVKLDKSISVMSKIAHLGGWIHNYNSFDYGRISVWWHTQKVAVKEISQGNQYIHCEIDLLDKKVLCTFIYAFNSQIEREELWAALARIHATMNLPWLIIEDFIHVDERVRRDVTRSVDTRELQNVVSSIGVEDLNFYGNFLTWCNRRDGEQRIYSKIDRALINAEWCNTFPHSHVVFLPPGISDHSPCLVLICEDYWAGRRPFRFCNMWRKHASYKTLVQNAWQEPVAGSPMFRIVTKLKRVNEGLKAFHKNQYSNLQQRIEEKKSKLVEVQAALSRDPFQQNLIDGERALQEEYKELLKAYLSLATQRAKATWLREVDTNSSYFHASVKERVYRSAIASCFY